MKSGKYLSSRGVRSLKKGRFLRHSLSKVAFDITVTRVADPDPKFRKRMDRDSALSVRF